MSRPPAAAPRPPVNKSWLAAQGRLPLAFMALALLWLAAASGLLVARPGLLLLPHAGPPVIALAHAWMLGFFVTVACGAVYQLAPVALSTTLWSERLGWMHFSLHALGVPGMVFLFWNYRLGPLSFFASATALGVLFFAMNTLVTVARSARRDVVTVSIVLATGWLACAVLAGLFLVANRLWALVPLDPLALLRAHAHLGLIGFFITLLQGVGFQLVPMFTMGEVKSWRLTKTGLWLSQTGLVALIPALIWQNRAAALVGGAAIGGGLVFSGAGLLRALAIRKKRRLDPGVAAFLCGWAGLCVAALAGVALLFSGANPVIYALLGIVGGLLPCVAGMMCKVVPFLTWMRAYGPKVGRGYAPPAHSLTRPRVERLGLALQQGSVLLLLAGVWRMDDFWLHAGVWVLAAGVVLFLYDMFCVLKHLWAPATAPTVNPHISSTP